METHDGQSIPAFARAAAEASQKLSGFEATETVEAGAIRAVARIGVHRPEQIAVEYQTYVNPLLELDERLTGDVEYTPEELVGLSLHYNGQWTWLYDASTGVCIVKPSRSLYEPLPDTPVLGEIEYLRDLPHDYLLRDLGIETIDKGEAHVLSLKPKRPHRVHAFKAITFLARKASVAFDTETLFPIRLSFSPAPASQSYRLLGPKGDVTVHYSGVRLMSDTPPPFAPPEGTRTFREEWIPIDELPDRLSFRISLAPFRDAEYEPIDGHALLTEDAENGRAFFAATFVHNSETGPDDTGLITLRAGNYLSRNMARRRVSASETGEELTINGRSVRFLDRRKLWEELAPGIDPSQAPNELSWEQDGVWFLIGVKVERSVLERIATDLIAASV